MTARLANLVDEFVQRVEEAIMTTARGQVDAAFTRRETPPRRGSTPRDGAKVSAARRLQGQYIGTLRGLTRVQRLRVRAIARRDGVAAALVLAKRLAG